MPDHRRLSWALGITLVVLVVEVAGGLLAHSLALLADAAHMGSDAAALALSLVALWVVSRPATAERTFGFHRAEILAALANGAALLIVAGLIFAEAYRRLFAPPAVRAPLMLAVAVLGLGANAAAALLLRRSERGSLNVRSAFLHVLSDLLGSAGAIAAALVIAVTGWTVADPVISALIGVLIVGSAWRMMRESVNVLLEGMPPGVRYAEVAEAIRTVPRVADLHDLHVWSITGDFPVLTSHVVIAEDADPGVVLHDLQHALVDRFGIAHATLQLEKPGETSTWVCAGDRCYPVAGGSGSASDGGGKAPGR